ncbi:hypothetical protein A2Z33_07160 [Candidatus Gottesmanbacteria bacterium RBG_16_52_11]|uniref:DUF3048 domain-containing protein n=1 Tax=Candidatus Gottesmanbacteria bacterium RBG_16_52_11 TaxID=1798374 RepID=A0A1F5YY61_9BACT|nr:MAG: hypothetical protein A2Z33_07160 [Candidatus Gottesmanbacteria bacterium RBG_16_52_11]
MNKQQYFVYGFIGIALYLISTGLSYAAFSAYRTANTPAKPDLPKTDGFTVDPGLPKTEECPINGKLFTKPERDIWEKRRPLAVMIENHEDSRPQSGLSKADVIYEAVAEGGITRFMGIFYCGVAENTLLAPVRSARTFFLPWVLEYDALYNHVGGAGRCNDPTVDERAKALCQIGTWKIKDMDQFGISFPTCYRNYDRLDHPVATEHTMVCSTDKLYALAAARGWTDVDEKNIPWDQKYQPWKFKDDASQTDRGAGGAVSFVAWKGYETGYGARFDYDPATNSYLRFTGGAPHTDLETKQQLTVRSLVIIFAKETGPVDDHAHLLYNNTGSGEGLLFQDGKSVKINWKKPDRNARTKFFDSGGKEILLNRGLVWITMLPIGTPVSY